MVGYFDGPLLGKINLVSTRILVNGQPKVNPFCRAVGKFARTISPYVFQVRNGLATDCSELGYVLLYLVRSSVRCAVESWFVGHIACIGRCDQHMKLKTNADT